MQSRKAGFPFAARARKREPCLQRYVSRMTRTENFLSQFFKFFFWKPLLSSLKFYNSFKCTFERESYIDFDLSYNELKRLSQFRMSSHKYNIETGRYGSKNGNILHRTCEHCTTEDKETIGLLLECPFLTQFLRMNNISSLHALVIPQQD